MWLISAWGTQLRWVAGVLSTVLLVALVYRPHALRGEAMSARFPPQRIVSMTLAADEILLALLPPERLLGLTYLSDDPRYSNSVALAARVRHKVSANAEQVIALQPDLIIASASAYTGTTARRFIRETGIALLELPWQSSFAGVQKNILAIGRAIGTPARAQVLVADMERRIQAVQERLAGAPRPRVLFYFPGGFSPGRGTTVDEMIRLAGGLNVAAAAGVRGVKQLSRESLISLNPTVILVGGWAGHPEGGSLRPLLLADPGMREIDAIQTGRVSVVPHTYVGSLSHYIVNGVEAMAQQLHPQAFAGAEARRL